MKTKTVKSSCGKDVKVSLIHKDGEYSVKVEAALPLGGVDMNFEYKEETQALECFNQYDVEHADIFIKNAPVVILGEVLKHYTSSEE